MVAIKPGSRDAQRQGDQPDSQPSSSPSPTKSPNTRPSDAPIERITPISRRRSSTLSEITPLKPTPPTTAIITAIIASNWMIRLKPSPKFATISVMVLARKVLFGLICRPRRSNSLDRSAAIAWSEAASCGMVWTQRVLACPFSPERRWSVSSGTNAPALISGS